MIYKETEFQMGKYWHSFCKDNLGAQYPQYMPACIILDLTPAELVKTLVTKYNAIVRYKENTTSGFFWKQWESQSDMRKWKNFINKKAREKGFTI